MSMRRKVEHVQRNAYLCETNILSNSLQTPTFHSEVRAEPSMVLSHGRSIISLSKSRFLTASRMMKYSMQASCNTVGRKNGANIWLTLEQSIFRTTAPQEQLERYAACYHFRYHPKYMEKGPLKSRPDYHETTRATVSMKKEAGQNPQIISRRMSR